MWGWKGFLRSSREAAPPNYVFWLGIGPWQPSVVGNRLKILTGATSSRTVGDPEKGEWHDAGRYNYVVVAGNLDTPIP